MVIGKRKVTKLGEYIRRAGYETDYQFAVALQQSPSALSLIANKKVLPLRPTLALICDLLNISPLDIYHKDEIDLLGCLKRQRGGKARQRKRRWRIEAQLGRELFKRFKTMLNARGLTTSEWIYKKVMEDLIKWEQGC